MDPKRSIIKGLPCNRRFIYSKRTRCYYLKYNYIWAASRQNQQNGCVPSEDSDQPGHLPSLIRVFVVRMKKAWLLSYPLSTQRRLWSDWADAQADLSLRWAHMPFCWFCHEVAHISTLLYSKAPWNFSDFISAKFNISRNVYELLKSCLFYISADLK